MKTARWRQNSIKMPPLHPGQREVARCPERYVVLVAGRRWGKTNLGVARALQTALAGGTTWWVAPIYGISNIGWRKLKRLARQIPNTSIREAERTIELPTGGTVSIKSAHDPDALRGEGLDGLVLDEAAYCDVETWEEVLRPALMDKKGWALFISTPKGRNWFYELYEAAAHKPHWARFQFPSSTNPFLDVHELEDAKRNASSLIFAQEYLGEFVDAVGALFKPEHFRYFTTIRDGNGDAWLRLDRVAPEEPIYYRYAQCRRYMAADLAVSTKTSADYTVAVTVAICPRGEMCVLDVARRRMEGPDIVPFLATQYRTWNPVSIGIEKAGFQLSIVQEARRSPYTLPVREVIADKDKVSRAMPLAAKMEGHTVYFDRYAPWLREYELEFMYFRGDGSSHDDQVDATVYADRMRQQVSGSVIRVM